MLHNQFKVNAGTQHEHKVELRWGRARGYGGRNPCQVDGCEDLATVEMELSSGLAVILCDSHDRQDCLTTILCEDLDCPVAH